MAKQEAKYKEGQVISITIGGLPNLPYINQPRNVEEHEFKTPPLPHKSEILYYDLPKKDQFWKRIEYPPLFYSYVPGVTEITDAESEILAACMKMDKERRRNGLWYMNNGVPNYLTGNNYYFLQWGDMLNGSLDDNGNSYPSYRKFQRDFFYFVEVCDMNDDCLGGYIAKSKKVGATQMLASIYANKGTLEEKILLGVMSKTGDECESTNMAMIKYMIDKMPQIILPKKGTQGAMKISFSHPSQKPTGTKQYKEKMQKLMNEKVLNTTIMGKTTKVGAFDGPRYKYLWFDEFPKYHQSVKISPKEIFEKDTAAVKLQQTITGKVWITAYTPEVDDKGFLEAKQIYYDSKKITINHDNILKRTKSNMFCYHISSLYATEGTFDKYGEADIEKAFKINDEERKNAVGDSNKLQALIRQQSRHEDESWMIGGAGSIFDNMRLMASKGDKEDKVFLKKQLYRRGNLRWTGPRFRSTIEFVDNPDGKWYITRLLDESLLNRFSIPDDGSDLIPSDTINFVGGNDPFEYKERDMLGNIGGSKGASYTLALPNSAMDKYYSDIAKKNKLPEGDSFSKRIISWYSERPPHPSTYFEDMVMETLYFGKKVLIEDNKAWLNQMFKDNGMRQFLLFQNVDTKKIEEYSRAKEKSKKHKQKSTQDGDVEEICRIISEYLKQPEDPEQPDLCMLIEDMELLTQLSEFDPFDTKKFDKVMAFGYALMALNSFSVFQKVNVTYDKINVKDLCRLMAS
jgi:hypothetical protein